MPTNWNGQLSLFLSFRSKKEMKEKNMDTRKR